MSSVSPVTETVEEAGEDGRMRTRRALGALAAAATLVVAGCGSDGDGASNTASGGGGKSALTFTAVTVEGADFSAASLEGKPAVFWFWAPWCSTCAAEAPHVAELDRQYRDRVSFVGVASLGHPDEMTKFIEGTGVSGLTHLNDQVGAVWQHFGITAQSTFALVDADGTVTYTGYLEMGELSDRVAELAG